MLSWTELDDGWHADCFHIQLAEPFRWLVLEEPNHEPTAVSLGMQPLAVARTLTEAKREAEILAAGRRRAETRKRHTLMLLGTLSGMALLASTSSAGSVLFIAVALLFATRSAAIVLGTLFPAALGEQHQVFYQ